VYNAGCLTVAGELNVGGLGNGGSGGASANYCWSRGELIFDEDSSLHLGDSSVIYVGGNHNKSYGDGILDTSIPIVLKSGQSIKIGNAYSNALHGGSLILRKNARLDNSSPLLEIGHYQYGKAKLVMCDNASITNVGKIRMSENSRIHSYIEMHGNSMITNINTIRISQTTGTRNGSRGHVNHVIADQKHHKGLVKPIGNGHHSLCAFIAFFGEGLHANTVAIRQRSFTAGEISAEQNQQKQKQTSGYRTVHEKKTNSFFQKL
jgi:hypothetical protein